MELPPRDFKSLASTIPPLGRKRNLSTNGGLPQCQGAKKGPLGQQMVPRVRLELTTPWLKVKCSTTELTEEWLGWLGSDQRIRESKSLALPLGYTPIKMVGEDGFEPPNPKELIYSQPRLATSLFTHVVRASFNPRWWMLQGSNLRPPPCKGDALPLS